MWHKSASLLFPGKWDDRSKNTSAGPRNGLKMGKKEKKEREKMARVSISFYLSVAFYFIVLKCYYLHFKARKNEESSLKSPLKINNILSLQMFPQGLYLEHRLQ